MCTQEERFLPSDAIAKRVNREGSVYFLERTIHGKPKFSKGRIIVTIEEAKSFGGFP